MTLLQAWLQRQCVCAHVASIGARFCKSMVLPLRVWDSRRIIMYAKSVKGLTTAPWGLMLKQLLEGCIDHSACLSRKTVKSVGVKSEVANAPRFGFGAGDASFLQLALRS